MRNINYNRIINAAKENGLNYACVFEPMEICPSAMFNGLDFIDTTTFEIPSAFEVERAIVVCLNDVAEDTTEYTDVVYMLSESKPQYIAIKDGFIKLMCWCTFEGDGEFLSIDEFECMCFDAIKNAFRDNWFDYGDAFDFRVSYRLLGESKFKPYTIEFSITTDGIGEMYELVKKCGEFDCELYANYPDMAEPTGKGVYGCTSSENDVPFVSAY